MSYDPTTRYPAQGWPGSEWNPAQSFDPVAHIQRLSTDPNACEVRWLRAFPDPTFKADEAEADTADKGREFKRVLQPGTHWVIIQTTNMLRRYYQTGTWEQGSVTVSFYYPTTPLSAWDIIIPLGQGKPTPNSLNTRTYTHKMTIERGQNQVDGRGVISNTGAVVTGSGTRFTADFQPGDIMIVANTPLLVQRVGDDTHLTLVAALPTDFTSIAYSKGIDRLLYPPVAQIADVRDTDGKVYTNGSDFVLSDDRETIQWLTPNAPPPGAGVGVIYDYVAQYELTDMGLKRQVVNGIPLLDMQVAKLYKPENQNR